ncbi:hypothetical protein [Paenibacillus sp. KN14-4R]|uniref:hypothetical protein n=1 Tax=Paenibacillus sp. KN14-4R TaxID=3445773 RepID=UPI003F9FAEBB
MMFSELYVMEKMMASNQAEFEKIDRQGLWRDPFKDLLEKKEKKQTQTQTAK